MDLIRRNKKLIIAGLAPALIVYAMFVIIPIFRSFYYGFTNWNGFGTAKLVGFQNFKAILKDSYFWMSFKNNILVVIASILGQIPIALILAIILSRRIRGVKFFRTIYFMPMVVSTVVVALLWSNIYNSQIGILNNLLNAVGLKKLALNWLGNPKIAIFSACIPIIWQYVGLYLIIFLAAIQNISESIFEAAEIDGATEIQKFKSITFPMLWNTVKVAVVLCIAGSMKTFDLIYVMTNGGPARSTEVMAIYMYNKTFTVYQYGYGSAVSTVIFIISLLFILLSQKLMKRNDEL
ncbi:carbohydrate ABC transporter permease [Clostridium oryzae]|uniref:Lactose transport system permease protein LacF n=1 Tax=Clostridium oryzae TaxID=1450648 RepID=A0A1V4I4C4_9CLOT|nr:sugar ABC transporter permease [Clostridium oryzae]OPJ54720.1 lactose transport system permease protein LacF [Clostridium oryzae]